MPSTFSPLLRIELIGQGEQSNTWGTTTNTNLGTLIEQAIAGAVTITLLTAATNGTKITQIGAKVAGRHPIPAGYYRGRAAKTPAFPDIWQTRIR